MKKWVRMFLTFLLLLLFVGCKKETSYAERVQWNSSQLIQLSDYERINQLSVSDNMVCGTAYTTQGEYRYFQISSNASESWKVPELEKMQFLGAFCDAEDGFGLSSYEENGQLQLERKSMHSTERIKYEVPAADARGEFISCSIDHTNGTCFILFQQLCYVFSEDGTLQKTIYSESEGVQTRRIVSATVLPDQGVFFLVKTYDLSNGKASLYIEKYQDSSVKIELPSEIAQSAKMILRAGNGSLYLGTDIGVFRMNPPDWKAVPLLDWTSLTLVGPDLQDFIVWGNGILAGIPDGQWITMTDDVQQKKILTLGTVQYTRDLHLAVSSFNQEQSEWQIKIKEYGQGEEYQNAISKMSIDLMTGKAPDLICVDGLPWKSYARQGVLYDLTDAMKEDLSTIYPGIVQAFQVEKRSFVVVPFLSIRTVAAISGSISKENWNMNEWMKLQKEYQEEMQFVSGIQTPEDYLKFFLSYNLEKYIQTESGTCNFMASDFQEQLQLTKEMVDGQKQDEALFDIEKMKSGDLLLTQIMLDSYQLPEEKKFQVQLDFPGYPTESGGISVAVPLYQVAVSAKTKYADGAMEFLRYLLSDQNQIREVMELFPVTKFAQKNMENQMIKREVTTQEQVVRIQSCMDNLFYPDDADQQILSIILDEASYYFAGDHELDETCKLIQSRAELYLLEQS